MRIGLFTDTYFPQVSGVATSIRTLKTELEKQDMPSLSLQQQIRMLIVMKTGRLFVSLVFLSLPLKTVVSLTVDLPKLLRLQNNTNSILFIPKPSFLLVY